MRWWRTCAAVIATPRPLSVQSPDRRQCKAPTAGRAKTDRLQQKSPSTVIAKPDHHQCKTPTTWNTPSTVIARPRPPSFQNHDFFWQFGDTNRGVLAPEQPAPRVSRDARHPGVRWGDLHKVWRKRGKGLVPLRGAAKQCRKVERLRLDVAAVATNACSNGAGAAAATAVAAAACCGRQACCCHAHRACAGDHHGVRPQLQQKLLL
eukprot:365143-Chlamydomonas_euryale.AAC.10